MKKILVLLLFISSCLQAQIQTTQNVATIADLKAKMVGSGNFVFVAAKNALGDNLGATYYWDAASTATEDMTYLNVIQSTLTTTGRWLRLLVRTQTLPGGILSMNGGKKEYFASAITDSNGEITLNLTLENTSGGTALFSDIRLTSAQMVTVPANINDTVGFYVKSVSTDKKVMVIKCYRGNQPVVTTLGTVLATYINAPSGVSMNVKIEGF